MNNLRNFCNKTLTHLQFLAMFTHMEKLQTQSQICKLTVRILKTSCKTNGTSSCNTQLYSLTYNNKNQCAPEKRLKCPKSNLSS